MQRSSLRQKVGCLLALLLLLNFVFTTISALAVETSIPTGASPATYAHVHPLAGQAAGAGHSAMQAGAPGHVHTGPGMILDLSSTTNSIVVSQHILSQLANPAINVGGHLMAVHKGELITPAEFAALSQIAFNHQQSLVLNLSGAAAGGTLSLNNIHAHEITSIVIPANVLASLPASATAFSISGALITKGTLLGLPGAPGTGLTIDAGSINVGAGGSITTQVPGLAAGSTALASPVNLSLISTTSIINAGSIISSGSLTLKAAGSIINQSTLPNTGAAPVVTAAQGLSIAAGQIVNAGSISSLLGSINFNALPGQNLVVNNLNGQINASSAINFQAEHGGQLTQLSGGRLQAQEINFFAGLGAIKVDADSIKGTVNLSGATADIAVADGQLTMGSMALTGDPNIANANGDVYLSSDIVLPGRDLAILALGSITAGPNVTQINLSNNNASFSGDEGLGNSGFLTMVAGFNFSPHTATPAPGTTPAPDSATYTLGTASAAGGSIVLPGVKLITSSQVGNGGAITLLAHGGSITAGQIDSSAPAANSGNVALIGQLGVQMTGSITTAAFLQAGSVTLNSGDPLVSGVTFTNGTCSCANPNYTLNTVDAPGTIVTQGINTSAAFAGNILLENAGGTMQINGAILATYSFQPASLFIRTSNAPLNVVLGSQGSINMGDATGSIVLGTIGQAMPVTFTGGVVQAGAIETDPSYAPSSLTVSTAAPAGQYLALSTLTTRGGPVSITNAVGDIAVFENITASQVYLNAQTNGIQILGSTITGTTGVTAVADQISLNAGSKVSASQGDVLLGSYVSITDAGTVTYNAGGNVKISSLAVTLGNSSQATAGSGIFLLAGNSVSIGNSVKLLAATAGGIANNVLAIQAGAGGITIGTSCTITSGTLAANFTPGGLLGAPGSATGVINSGSIWLIADTITLGSGMTANGGGIQVLALTNPGGTYVPGNNIVLDNNLTYQANGGTILMAANGQVTGSNDKFISYAAGSSQSFAGGAIEVGSGIGLAVNTTYYFLAPPPHFIYTNPNLLGGNITINNNNIDQGVLLLNQPDPGTVNINGASVNISRGAVEFDANGSTSALVSIPGTGSQFVAESYNPGTGVFLTSPQPSTFTSPAFPATPDTSALPAIVNALVADLLGLNAAYNTLQARTQQDPGNSFDLGALSNVNISQLAALHLPPTDLTPHGLKSSSVAQLKTGLEPGKTYAYRPSYTGFGQVEVNVIHIGAWQSNLILFTTANQFLCGNFGGSKNAVITGSTGTAISEGRGVVYLHAGHIVADAGESPMVVEANGEVITIPAQSTASLDVSPGTRTRVMAVGGSTDAAISVKPKTGTGKGQSIKVGQELIVADRALSEEDLIPADGIEHTVIAGGIELHGARAAKMSFPVEQFFKKAVAPSIGSVRLSGSRRMAHQRLISHVASAARRQNPQFHMVQLAAAGHAAGLAEPVRLLAAEGSSLSMSEPDQVNLDKGAVFLNAARKMSVRTSMGSVNIVKGAITAVESTPGLLRVKALSGPGHVHIRTGKEQLVLRPGQEVLIADHKPEESELHPADGIGRRSFRGATAGNGSCVVYSDFSIVTFLASTSYVKEVRQHTSARFEHVLKQLVKTAAAVEFTTASKGRYALQQEKT